MARDPAAWSAPSVDTLSHRNIRLDIDPQLVRDIWRAKEEDTLKHVLERAGHPEAYQKAYDQVAPTCRAGRDPYLLQVKRQLLNNLAGFFGVEYLGVHRRSGRSVRYLNAGDTYATTLIFTGRRMTVGCWGDLVETKAVKTPPERVW